MAAALGEMNKQQMVSERNLAQRIPLTARTNLDNQKENLVPQLKMSENMSTIPVSNSGVSTCLNSHRSTLNHTKLDTNS